MRQIGSESWRFGEETAQIPHGLLFVRDALGLDVEGAADIPPRLAGDVPNLGHLLAPRLHLEAAAQWPSWWRAVVQQEVAMHLGQGDIEGRQRRTTMRVVDPPEWSSLDDQPALQAAARATFEQGCQWFDSKRRPLQPPQHQAGLFEWRATKDIAERVAAELGVSVGLITGFVMVFLVEGVWWELTSSGVAFCSLTATQHSEIAEIIQRSVFASGVPGGPTLGVAES